MFDHKRTAAVFSLSVHVILICATSDWWHDPISFSNVEIHLEVFTEVFSPYLVSNQGPFCMRWTCDDDPHTENCYCDKTLDPQAFWAAHSAWSRFVSIQYLVSFLARIHERTKNILPKWPLVSRTHHAHVYTHKRSHPCKERHVCVSISPVSQISSGMRH